MIGFLLLQLIYSKLKVGKNVVCKNIPSILILNNSTIKIEDDVMLNSSNFGYHINMFKGVKLLADGKNAEIIIGSNTRIHGSCIHATKKIEIGKNCLIAANCQIIDNNAHELMMQNPSQRMNTIDEAKEIFIADNVWIGAGSIILPGTKIGNGSVITANSVVRGDIPPACIWGGNPAVLIKQF